MVVVEQSNVLPSSLAGAGASGERGFVVDNPFFAEAEVEVFNEDTVKDAEEAEKNAHLDGTTDVERENDAVGEDEDEEETAARAAFGDDAIAILKGVEERERQEKVDHNSNQDNHAEKDETIAERKTDDAGDNGSCIQRNNTDNGCFERPLSSSSTAIIAPRQTTTAAESSSSSFTLATTAAPILQALVSGHATQAGTIKKLEQLVATEVESQVESTVADLLICLGQEGEKVERLRATLEDVYGVNTSTLLAGIEDDEDICGPARKSVVLDIQYRVQDQERKGGHETSTTIATTSNRVQDASECLRGQDEATVRSAAKVMAWPDDRRALAFEAIAAASTAAPIPPPLFDAALECTHEKKHTEPRDLRKTIDAKKKAGAEKKDSTANVSAAALPSVNINNMGYDVKVHDQRKKKNDRVNRRRGWGAARSLSFQNNDEFQFGHTNALFEDADEEDARKRHMSHGPAKEKKRGEEKRRALQEVNANVCDEKHTREEQKKSKNDAKRRSRRQNRGQRSQANTINTRRSGLIIFDRTAVSAL